MEEMIDDIDQIEECYVEELTEYFYEDAMSWFYNQSHEE